ncbi:uncharacterized protein B0I36DRAFT_311070 [Microdochium trichocladiopsis]|uniref:Uncharacterized protein n=1 Tax=Microdochium trichocladiopsis TaxID=1682393 RepID=A0A9P8YKB7_9PEZI|nr:uncharacterized protein B0I36DRAFT_311070 [Microdochium trichocladiopsis]KAH7040599.1 hypothetical protein B0I36DRAFT_311070 [Microdochium trichocladiopsis]
MRATLVRRLASLRGGPGPAPASAPKLSPENIYSSQYKPKKVWPPDFSKLSEKEQFRFERRYQRRVKLATARPRWDKYVRLAQLFSVSFVGVYTVFWMDWQTENPPFEGVRQAFRNAFASFSPDEQQSRRYPQSSTTSDK